MIKQTYVGLIFALVGLVLSGCSTPFAPGASFTALTKTGIIHSNPSLSESYPRRKLVIVRSALAEAPILRLKQMTVQI